MGDEIFFRKYYLLITNSDILSFVRRGSSVVEQRPEKPCVGSSILLLGTSQSSINSKNVPVKNSFLEFFEIFLLILRSRQNGATRLFLISSFYEKDFGTYWNGISCWNYLCLSEKFTESRTEARGNTAKNRAETRQSRAENRNNSNNPGKQMCSVPFLQINIICEFN